MCSSRPRTTTPRHGNCGRTSLASPNGATKQRPTAVALTKCSLDQERWPSPHSSPLGRARLRSLGASSREHLVSPTGVTVLRDEMSLVSAVVAARSREALAQGLELLEPLGPLSLPVL